ncbi:MAG: FG-GAP repeat protein, partial [Planctomycetota bacterium]|nr:FG-GAP repeat protein [Planctomycetota bacterium]
AIVGARLDDDNGSFSGSAYLFDTTTGRQIAKLLANDGAELDVFGSSVAISGTTAIVGAFFGDDNGDKSGSAYLFDTTTGRQIAKLLPYGGAAGDWFGDSVAISGETAIVGAPGDDDNGTGSGSAYLFDISDPANPMQLCQLLCKLLPDDGAVGDIFGGSVAISGATAIVAAAYDDDNGSFSGSAYLFDTTSGEQIAQLLPEDGATDDLFGWSVAISGTTALAGALVDDDNGDFSGSAYLFDAAAAPGMCPWDLNGNSDVGILDLLALLAAWGTDPGGPPDFDGDGNVGIIDLLTLLANWGECP